ncbi:putative actin patch assembly and actin polymerization protein [Hypocenomyce scalaris]|nr:putative actin patch assembly and actin polymerization protein [Hypocenomyce scalaris]
MLSSLLSLKHKKPYSAITVQIERLTSEQYELDDFSGIVDLIEVIRLQDSGPTEAARAIRKKLKYGSIHKQLRALTILDGLIQNAGPRFQRAFADEPLLERLRVAATDPLSDAEVKEKCQGLFRQWAVSYKATPGMERIAALYKQLPQRKKPVRQDQSKVLKETEEDAQVENDRPGQRASLSSGGDLSQSPTSSSGSRPVMLSAGPSLTSPTKMKTTKAGKKVKVKVFNLEKEKPQLLQTIASSSVASTNLLNSLKFINREHKRVSEDAETVKRFETCKVLRRQILRYIQLVESEQWLGSLIHANDELVTALMAFEVLDKSVEDDSDSEDEWGDTATSSAATTSGQMDAQGAFAGLSLGGGGVPPKPPRSSMAIAMPPANGKGKQEDGEEDEEEADNDDFEEEDENDPFADRNAVYTPKVERPGMTW